jgi:hypothetical protein
MTSDNEARSELERLTELNRDYIRSVQHGDVERFDEILAPDFLCSNPDGSLVDVPGTDGAAGDDQGADSRGRPDQAPR